MCGGGAAYTGCQGDKAIDALSEHNLEAIELWLLTRAMRLSTRPPAHPDEYHGRVGKPRSTVNQDDVWLQAISDPDMQRTDHLLSVLVDGWLGTMYPKEYTYLHAVYIGSGADESLPEYWRWRRRVALSRGRHHEARKFLLARLRLERALSLLVSACGRRVLTWPHPDEARGFVDERIKKRRIARQVYFTRRHEGDRPGEAIRAAMAAAKASRASVYYWTTTERKKRRSA